MKLLTSSPKVVARTTRIISLRDAVWEWLFRPTHYAAIRSFRTAAQARDEVRLASMLHPGISVAVTSGDPEEPETVVARGVRDVLPILILGLADRAVVATERSINGQAGLVLERDGDTTGLITVDFTGRLVSLVWVRLHPEHHSHWNSYWLDD